MTSHPPAPIAPVVLPAASVPSRALYVPPSPIPAGAPGGLLRVQAIHAQSGARAWAVLYRSTGIDGRPIAVSGLVIAPAGAPPLGGRPILAWGHGTLGLADACAPSHAGDTGELEFLAAPLIQRGFVVVATDYEGFGTPGVPPYLVGGSEGRSVLDVARAARLLGAAGAGNRVVLLGHSQGGHAVLWAAQLATSYAPELRIVTTVAVAPAADLQAIATWIEGPASPPVARLNGLLVATAWHATLGLPYAGFLTPEGAAIVARLPTACPDTPLAPSGQPFTSAARSDPRFLAQLAANTPGASKAAGSILILQGTADEQVPADTNRAETARLCKAGDTVRLDILDGVDHSGALVNEVAKIGAWILDRMAGRPVAGECGGPS